MHHTHRVRSCQRLCERHSKVKQPLRWEPVGANDTVQGGSRHEFHRDEGPFASVLDGVDGDHERVVQSCDCARLLRQPLDPLRIVGKVGWQELERHVTVQLEVTSSIDLAHPPSSELFDDLVVPQLRSEHAHRTPRSFPHSQRQDWRRIAHCQTWAASTF